jgi:hypothetical protein
MPQASTRLALVLGGLLLLTPTPRVLAAPAPTSEEESQLAELTRLEKELEALTAPSWHSNSKLGLLAGYESNPLLSSYALGGAALARGELDNFSWLRQWHGCELIGMLHGSVTRYINPPPGLAGEQNWFLHAELRRQAFTGTRFSVSGTAFLSDEVIDLSVNDAFHQVAPLRVWGEKAKLQLRQTLTTRLWLEAEGDLQHSSYLHYAGAYTEPGATLRLGCEPGAGLTLSLAALGHRRAYSERNENNAGGRALPGTRLHLLVREAEAALGWKHAWHGAWELGAKARQGETRDEASGFFDYRQRLLEVTASWESGDWKLSADYGVTHYRYLLQTVGAGLTPPHRTLQNRDLDLQLDYKLSEKLSLQLSLQQELSRTNEDFSDYTNRSVVLGLHREF